MTKLPIALQVYSVRDHAEKDLFAALEKIAELGYVGVEFAGLYDNDASAVRNKLDELGLKAISMHVPVDQLFNNTDESISVLTTLGCPWAAIPWMETSACPGGDDWAETKANIIRAGKACAKSGITLLYHNHDFEFEKVGDEYKLDIMYKEIGSDILKTEIDTCWVRVGGENPSQYLPKYSGRAPIVHLKDFERGYGTFADNGKGDSDTMQKGRGEDFDFRPVGYGEQNIPSVVKASEQIGAKWLVVEQDRSTGRDTYEAAKMSIEYIKDNC